MSGTGRLGMQSRPSRSRKHEEMGLNTVPVQQHRFSEIPGAFVFCQLRHEPRLPLLVQPHQRQAWAGAGSFDVTTPNRPELSQSPTTPLHRRHSRGLAAADYAMVFGGERRLHPPAAWPCSNSHEPHERLAGILARILAAPIRGGAHVRRYPPVAVRRSIRRPDPSGEGQRLLIIRCEDGRSVRRGVAQEVQGMHGGRPWCPEREPERVDGRGPTQREGIVD